jgi:hypothetical protein
MLQRPEVPKDILENVLKDSPQRLSPNTCNDVKVLQKIIF